MRRRAAAAGWKSYAFCVDGGPDVEAGSPDSKRKNPRVRDIESSEFVKEYARVQDTEAKIHITDVAKANANKLRGSKLDIGKVKKRIKLG